MLEVRGYKKKNDTGYEVIAICYTEEQAKQSASHHTEYDRIEAVEIIDNIDKHIV